MVPPWKLRFRETAMLTTQEQVPQELEKLDHRKASRNVRFKIGKAVVIQNSPGDEKSKAPLSLVLARKVETLCVPSA